MTKKLIPPNGKLLMEMGRERTSLSSVIIGLYRLLIDGATTICSKGGYLTANSEKTAILRKILKFLRNFLRGGISAELESFPSEFRQFLRNYRANF